MQLLDKLSQVFIIYFENFFDAMSLYLPVFYVFAIVLAAVSLFRKLRRF